MTCETETVTEIRIETDEPLPLLGAVLPVCLAYLHAVLAALGDDS